MDVAAFLRELPIGAVFTHANPALMPDSWVKVDIDAYRRTYDWILFHGNELANQWNHAELTTPVPGSFDNEEAERRKHAELSLRRDEATDVPEDDEPVDGETYVERLRSGRRLSESDEQCSRGET